MLQLRILGEMFENLTVLMAGVVLVDLSTTGYSVRSPPKL